MRIVQGMLLMGLACVALASCGKKHEASAPKAVKVEVWQAQAVDISSSRVFSGTVEESSGSTLSFPVAGTLQTVYVSQGDHVAKGQLVAALDPGSLQNAYDIAQAALDQAQDTYNRMKMLHDANSLPEMQWVETQNALRSAQDAAAIAKRTLNDAKLYAPVSGFVAEKIAEVGMTVAPGLPIVKIVKIDPIKVKISVPENEIAEIKVGQGAAVSVASIPGRHFEGKVAEKGVAANPLSRSYDVKIIIDNADGVLLPGMVSDVRLQSEQPRLEVVLPNDAVLLDADNHNFVWLALGGVAEKREVVVEGMADDGLIISSGIAAGDSVIVKGQQKVSQGSKIEVVL